MARSILSRDSKHMSMALYPRARIAMKRAYEVYVEDVDGNRYIDFTAGETTAVGYSHPAVAKATIDQVKKGMDPTADLWSGVLETRSELAEEIKKFVSPTLADGKIVFGHSGSDIIERSIRLVRFAMKKPMIISYFEAHHGACATALSASPSLKEMGSNVIARFFQLPGFLYMPYPDSYRPWFGTESDAGVASLAFLERLLSSVISPELVAGVIVEPILSAGGIVVPPKGYFEGLVRICHEYHVPLIADEVLTGIGKTGRMFALEHWGVWPDVLCLGKALSCSLPLSLLLADSKIGDRWEPKDYAAMSKEGHVLGCAVALATIRVVREERLIDRARKMGAYLIRRLQDLKRDRDLVGQVRGLGLMLGFDLVESEKTRKADSTLARKVLDRALKHGLILGIVGAKQNVLRFMPSLVVDEQHIDTAVEILDQVFKELGPVRKG